MKTAGGGVRLDLFESVDAATRCPNADGYAVAIPILVSGVWANPNVCVWLDLRTCLTYGAKSPPLQSDP